jgi:hypothetical protein
MLNGGELKVPTGGYSMKRYVITTGVVFGLLVVVHIWRVVEEGPAVAKDPL